MAPDERVLDTGIILPADSCEDCSALESLGMRDQLGRLDAGHGYRHSAGHISEVIMKEPVEEENAIGAICSSKPLDKSPGCADSSKGSELPDDNDVGSTVFISMETSSGDHLENMAHFSYVTQSEEPVENMALISHVPQRLSMRALKERFKDKLEEKLKPKLRLNYFKHRQETSSHVIPWVPIGEVVLPQQYREAAHYAHMNPFVSDVAPLKVLPAGVKTEPEQGTLHAPPFLFSLGREPTGPLVPSVLNGRKSAGNKTSQLSRVNRFAESILQFVGEKSVPEKLIRGALGNNPDISKAIRLLLSEKRLKRLGDGGKGCAYVYVRTDLAEAKPKTNGLDQVDINAQALTIEQKFLRELERRFPATNKLDSIIWNRYGRMQGVHLQCDI